VPVLSAETITLYRRATALETRTGIVEIRAVQEALADVPVECAGDERGSLRCWEEQRFSRIYGLRFILERRDARCQEPSIEVEARGEVYLLLHFEREELDAFDWQLRHELAALPADRFVSSHARLSPESWPSIALSSPKPSWSCFERDNTREVGLHSRTLTAGPEGEPRVVEAGTRHIHTFGQTERLCRTASLLLQSAPPDEVRTMSSIAAVREETVGVRFVGRIPAVAQPEDLMPIPDRFLYTTREGQSPAEGLLAWSDETGTATVFAEDGTRIESVVVPAAFPAHKVVRGWLGEWTVDTVEREMGPQPAEQNVRHVVVRSALVPTRAPIPLAGDGGSSRTPFREAVEPRFDKDAYLQTIRRGLEYAEKLEAAAIVDLIGGDSAGFRSSSFVLFICHNGSATFQVLPTTATQRVTNAEEVCSAIDRALERQ
jgi:hypothetical protein